MKMNIFDVTLEGNVPETPAYQPINELTLKQHKKEVQESEVSSPVCYANSDEVREEFREQLPAVEMEEAKKAQKDQGKL